MNAAGGLSATPASDATRPRPGARNIVTYYDKPGAEGMKRLEGWAGLHDGQWSGLVVTPAAGLGEAVVLTAWTKRLELDTFNPAGAAAFIDAYRGRGPEHPVR